MGESISFTSVCHQERFLLFEVKQQALRKYCALGWKVIPVHGAKEGKCLCGKISCSSPGKHPATRGGVYDGSSDLDYLTSVWQKNPGYNIGVVTGESSGIFVVDVDRKSGGLESFKKFEALYGSFEQTYKCLSGDGGFHLYFNCPQEKIKNKTSILPGIDIRGEGGYIIAPPSIHFSGKAYIWSLEQSIAKAPQSLISALTAKLVPKNLSNKTKEKIGKGERNSTLLSIGGFLLAREFDFSLVENTLNFLNREACQEPLPLTELKGILKSLKGYEDTYEWDFPQSLESQEGEVYSLEDSDIPKALQAWVIDICDRMQVELEFVVGPALVAASSLIGSKIGVHPLQEDDWLVVPNLWGFLVSEPGSMKSPAMIEALKPLDRLERSEKKEFQVRCQDSQKQEKTLVQKIDSLKKCLNLEDDSLVLGVGKGYQEEILQLEQELESQEVVTEKRYKTNDPTVEKLALILKDNPQGLLLFRDELGGWLESLSKKGREGNREFYLETWNGLGSFSVDRIGRGSVYVENMCLSLFGGIQPTKIESYIEKNTSSSGDDGFLERFQIVFYPEKRQVFSLIDRKPNKEAFEAVLNIYRFLDQIEGRARQNSLRFSKEAQEITDDWRKDLEFRILNESLSPIHRAHISKYRSLMPSLSLVFCLLEAAADASFPNEIEAVFAKKAINWCTKLESHLNKLYQNSVHNALYSAKVLAEKIQSGAVSDGEKLRDLARKNWRGLNTPGALQEALKVLEEKSWLKREAKRSGGKKSEYIRINPKVMGGFK